MPDFMVEWWFILVLVATLLVCISLSAVLLIRLVVNLHRNEHPDNEHPD
jgi:hypothetical protein